VKHSHSNVAAVAASIKTTLTTRLGIERSCQAETCSAAEDVHQMHDDGSFLLAITPALIHSIAWELARNTLQMMTEY